MLDGLNDTSKKLVDIISASPFQQDIDLAPASFSSTPTTLSGFNYLQCYR